jgi:hypothetical protein
MDPIFYIVISNDSSQTARILDASNPYLSSFTFVGVRWDEGIASE